MDIVSWCWPFELSDDESYKHSQYWPLTLKIHESVVCSGCSLTESEVKTGPFWSGLPLPSFTRFFWWLFHFNLDSSYQMHSVRQEAMYWLGVVTTDTILSIVETGNGQFHMLLVSGRVTALTPWCSSSHSPLSCHLYNTHLARTLLTQTRRPSMQRVRVDTISDLNFSLYW